ncbi:MAG: hypothetical protein SGPRY_012262, partial [Prymnesium sp.]
MLLADKRDLENRLKVSVLHIEEKELQLYTNNCNTIGTQAALLSGFAFTAIIETPLDAFIETTERDTKSVWYAVTIVTMLLELAALVKAMQLSLWAPNLALRGPEGSMTVSLIVMRAEYKKVQSLFYAGLVGFHASATMYAWAFSFQELVTLPSLTLCSARASASPPISGHAYDNRYLLRAELGHLRHPRALNEAQTAKLSQKRGVLGSDLRFTFDGLQKTASAARASGGAEAAAASQA